MRILTLSGAAGALGEAYFDIYDFDARAQWDIPLTRDAELLTGFDIIGQHLSGAYSGSVASASEGDFDYPDAARGELIVEDSMKSLRGIVQRSDLCEREREAGRLLLAFDRYRQMHDELPKDLVALYAAVPELDPIPLDPLTGEWFLYDPESGEIGSEGKVAALESTILLQTGIEPAVWSVYGTDPDVP